MANNKWGCSPQKYSHLKGENIRKGQPFKKLVLRLLNFLPWRKNCVTIFDFHLCVMKKKYNDFIMIFQKINLLKWPPSSFSFGTFHREG